MKPRSGRSRLYEGICVFAKSPFSTLTFLLYRRLKKQRICRLRFDGVWLHVRTLSRDLTVVRSALRGEYEPALNATTIRHRFIVDAGGYIGTAAIVFARRFPEATIVCLEPSIENYELARANCAPWPNIEVLNCALAKSEGIATLRDRGTGQWGFTIVDNSADNNSLKYMHEVETTSIEHLLGRYGRRGIDLLKLDIEGGEYELLRDAPSWVQSCETIMAEIHDKICPGASEAFNRATRGRREIAQFGEKRISLRH